MYFEVTRKRPHGVFGGTMAMYGIVRKKHISGRMFIGKYAEHNKAKIKIFQ